MTFLELQDSALTALNHSTTVGTAPRTRVKASINLWQRRILTRPGYQRLLRDNQRTFDSVSSQSVYGLVFPLGRLDGISERTNDRRLVRRDLAWIRRADPGLRTLGTPEAYVLRGWFPIQTQPSTADDLYLVSTSAGDVQVALWEVILSDGSRRSGTTTLTGTTAVQISTFTTAIEMTRLTLATAAVGTVTVRQSTGAGTTLGTIYPGTTQTRYLHIQLWPTPQSAITYYVDYTREIADLAQDYEEPLLPLDFHHVLALGAQYDEWKRMDDDRASLVWDEMDAVLRNLHSWLWDLAETTDEQRDVPWRRSRLGGWYPVGT